MSRDFVTVERLDDSWETDIVRVLWIGLTCNGQESRFCYARAKPDGDWHLISCEFMFWPGDLEIYYYDYIEGKQDAFFDDEIEPVRVFEGGIVETIGC
jgi:hypothetical protein